MAVKRADWHAKPGRHLPPESESRLAEYLVVAAIIVAALYFAVIAASWALGVHG